MGPSVHQNLKISLLGQMSALAEEMVNGFAQKSHQSSYWTDISGFKTMT